MYVLCCLVAKSPLTLLGPHGLSSSRLLCPWNFPDKNTVVDCHFLLQRIFPTQGSNPHLLHWQAGSLPLSHQGSHVFSLSSAQSPNRVPLCNPVNHSTPGLRVHHHLPEFTQTHVHQVGNAIQPSHPLSSPSPPAPNPSQHQSLFQ